MIEKEMIERGVANEFVRAGCKERMMMEGRGMDIWCTN
jgi:hypothetical protein